LPILPAAALLVARLLREPLDALNAWSLRLVKLAYGLIALAVLLSAVAFFPPRWFLPLPYALLPMAPNQPVLIVCWIGSMIALAYGLLRFGPKRIMISTGTFAYLFLIYVFVVAMPSADRWRGEKPFANRVRQIIDGRTADLTFFGNSELSFYLELPRAVPEYRSRSELNDAVRQGRVHWLVTRRRDLDYLPAPFHVAASETTYLWNTNERNRNAMVLVQVEWPRR